MTEKERKGKDGDIRKERRKGRDRRKEKEGDRRKEKEGDRRKEKEGDKRKQKDRKTRGERKVGPVTTVRRGRLKKQNGVNNFF
jgi:hypothetical protein